MNPQRVVIDILIGTIIIALSLCLFIVTDYGTKPLKYGEGCDHILEIIRKHWSRPLAWGNTLCHVFIWYMVGAETACAIIIYSIYKFIKTFLELVFKKRG